jgi:hypothetical protein
LDAQGRLVDRWARAVLFTPSADGVLNCVLPAPTIACGRRTICSAMATALFFVGPRRIHPAARAQQIAESSFGWSRWLRPLQKIESEFDCATQSRNALFPRSFEPFYDPNYLSIRLLVPDENVVRPLTGVVKKSIVQMNPEVPVKKVI